MPYYIEPSCPTSISLAGSAVEMFTNQFFTVGHRTGVGLFTEMQLNPANGLWSSSQTPSFEGGDEILNSNTCYGSGDLCGYQTHQFNSINRQYTRKDGMLEPAMPNIFYDEHTNIDGENGQPLGTSMLNQLHLVSCQASCYQVYYCGGHPVSNYRIDYTFQTSVINGSEITFVQATKAQTGSDSSSSSGGKK